MAKVGRQPKIDLDILADLLKKNTPLKECAEYFGCKPPAISVAKRKLGLGVVRHVAAERAPEVVERKLNAIDQLQTINDHANWLLNHVMKWIKGDDSAIQALEGQIRKINIGTRKAPEYVEEYKFQDPHKIALDSMAEIRNQLRLQLEIFKTLYDAEAVKEFQQELISLLGETSPELRDKFIQRLREKGAIRSILEFAGPTIR